MSPLSTDPPTLSRPQFIERWAKSGAAERANFPHFLVELCDILGVPRPDPATPDASRNAYVFERAVPLHHPDGSTSTGRIDLYKRDCFVLEAKQGVDAPSQQPTVFRATTTPRGIGFRQTEGWDAAMYKARNQAEQYARALPREEGWPPFLVIVDVGYSIELFANFARDGKAYLPFPDPRSHRIFLNDLLSPDVCALLRTVWTDPLSLDPSRISAKVTRHVAAQLAELAKQLELLHPPERVAAFLMRCIFTSFAEDVRLLRERSWTGLLESLRDDLPNFVPMVESLWQTMNTGGYSPFLREHVLRFNGRLFEQTEALGVTRPQWEPLIRAAPEPEPRGVSPGFLATTPFPRPSPRRGRPTPHNSLQNGYQLARKCPSPSFPKSSPSPRTNPKPPPESHTPWKPITIRGSAEKRIGMNPESVITIIPES
jgi:hypothetical protein